MADNINIDITRLEFKHVPLFTLRKLKLRGDSFEVWRT